MNTPRSQTIETPDGAFVVIEASDGAVLASGWSDSIDCIASQAGIEVEVVAAAEGDLLSAQAVRGYYAGEVRAIDSVRVAAQGTQLQQEVWAKLREIEPGASVSYGELTRALGHPQTAVRAVAGACARNPVGLFVPCHRVVASTGALSGFAWGIEVKAALLEREMLGAI